MPKFTSTKVIVSICILVAALAIIFGPVWVGKVKDVLNIQSGPYEVVLKENGYNPARLIIQEGDTVTFKTELGIPHWPASNVHPTHTAFPDFDPQGPVNEEESWSFTFTKAGTYRFHDHISSNFEGEIIVEKKDGSRVSIDCSQERNVQCWEKLMLDTLEKEGVESALNTIVRLSETEPLFLNDCHGYSHLIGEKAYKLYVEQDNFELTGATALCGYGFYHGFMETLLLATGNIDEAREFCRIVDQKLAGKASAAATACYHGTGHGAIDGSDPTAWGDPNAMMEPGFKVCELLATNELETYLCDTGVFNAIEILSRDPKYMITEIKHHPFALCNEQPLERREGCYSNMLPLVLENANNDIKKASEYINEHMIDHDEIAIDGHTVNELVTIGLMFEFIRLHGEDPNYAEKGVALCRTMPENDQIACIKGLSGGHLKYGAPGIEYMEVLKLCSSNLLNEPERDGCYEYSLMRLNTRYDGRTTSLICEEVPEPYREKYCTL